MSDAIRYEMTGAVAVITLDRPEVRNAVDRAGVLTGSSAAFSAGMDLKAFNATGERPITARRGGFGIVERPPAKPLIAAVEGQALGGGFEIALACDLIVAADDASFGLPEVTRGLVATAGGVLRLPRRIPRHVAMELILTGAPIGARAAAPGGTHRQAPHRHVRGLGRRRGVRPAGSVRRARPHVGGRGRGSAGLRREAGAAVAELVTCRREPS